MQLFITDSGDWSSGMIPALGAGGHGFDSRITPTFFAMENQHERLCAKKNTRLVLRRGLVDSGILWCSLAIWRDWCTFSWFVVVSTSSLHTHAPTAAKSSPAGIRTRVLWVKATYPNRLDYGGTTSPLSYLAPPNLSQHERPCAKKNTRYILEAQLGLLTGRL